MKISKRQLRRIIKEEKAKLVRETRDQQDQALKNYQDNFHGEQGRFFADIEAKMEDAIFSAVDMFVELNGVSVEEAEQMVVDHVKDVLGVRQ